MRLLYGRGAIHNVLPSAPFHLLLDDVLALLQWLNKELLMLRPDHSRLEKIRDDILDKNLKVHTSLYIKHVLESVVLYNIANHFEHIHVQYRPGIRFSCLYS